MAPLIIYNKPQLLTGGGFVFSAQTVSLDFDGDAGLRETTPQTIGMANLWSVSAWVKPTSGGSGDRFIFGKRPSANSNNSVIIIRDSFQDLRLRIFDENHNINSDFREQTYNQLFNDTDWHHILAVFVGSTDSLSVYIDGALASPTSDNSTSVTQVDAAVEVAVGDQAAGASRYWEGLIHQVAVWDVDVSAGIDEIYNGGDGGTVNLRSNNGGYTFSSDLQHWWRLGNNSGNLGEDSGVGSNLVQLDEVGNMGVDRIVSDVPT